MNLFNNLIPGVMETSLNRGLRDGALLVLIRSSIMRNFKVIVAGKTFITDSREAAEKLVRQFPRSARGSYSISAHVLTASKAA